MIKSVSQVKLKSDGTSGYREQNDTPVSMESRCSSWTIINMSKIEYVGLMMMEGMFPLGDIWFMPGVVVHMQKQLKQNTQHTI